MTEMWNRMMGKHLDYTVHGGNLQAVRFVLQPGQAMIGEAGCMLFLDPDITFESRLGNGSTVPQNDSWWNAFKTGMGRLATNESLFFTWFINSSSVPRAMGVAAPTMGTVIPLKLHDYPESTIVAQSGAFLCSSPGVVFTIEFTKSIGAGFFAGEGFVLQKMVAEANSAGSLFLHGGGTIVEKKLNNEEMEIDAGCLMAFTKGVSYDWKHTGWSNTFKGGDAFFVTLNGTGSVWVQSTPSSKTIDLIVSAVPEDKKSTAGTVIELVA